MKVLDISALEARLKPLGIAELVLRMFNSGTWLCYWLFVPLLSYIAFVGLWSFGAAMSAWPGLSFVVDSKAAAENAVRLFGLSAWYLAANLTAFGYRRRWAVVALALSGLGIATTGADWVRFGPAVLRLDPVVFWFGLASWLVTNSLVVLLMVACASVFRLDRRRRELLRPLRSPKIFPRRRFRSMTALPDVIDFVQRRRSRLWISLQYMGAAGFFLILPANLLQSYSHFTTTLTDAQAYCADRAPNEFRSCFVAYEHVRFIVQTLSMLVIVVLAWLFAARLLARAQRRLTFSLDDVAQADARPPILFLRSFADDQVSLSYTERSWLYRMLQGRQKGAPFEHLLVQRLTPIGPVVALGRPTETEQPYGAARTYRPIDDWQDKVLELFDKAAHVVIVLDDTAGLLWELEQAAAGDRYAKCIFLVHPRFAAPADNLALLRRLESRGVVPPELVQAAASRFSAPVLGWFDLDGSGARVCLSRTFSARSLELLLRWFEKVVAHRHQRHVRRPAGSVPDRGS